MNERDLFLSALEIDDPAARKAHLQAACADNGELLTRVESLLASHEGESRFLQTPVGEQLGDDPTGQAAATLVMGTGSTDDESPAGEAASILDFSHLQERTKMSDEIPLGYLEPSTKPGSLGRLAHYEILEVIGQGAFGTVLRAFDEKLQRVVAIKVMAPELAATSPARKRFIREAQASAQIRHENVVSVYAVEEKPIPNLVMEYIPGVTLQQRLDERGPLEVLTVLRLGKQIAEGLAAAHAKDLIHRDIKPGNILLESGMRDRVKITDFGLARAADDASMSQSGVIAGTPMYMAPEQALGHKLDQRADLFSFGSVLYQMVSGRPPFRASSTLAVLKRLTEDTPRPIREIIPETPTWLCDIIAKLHAKNPDERYQSAREIVDVLANCESQLKEHSRLKDLSLIPRAKPQPAGWWKWIAAAAVAAVILPLIAVGIYALTRPGSKPVVGVSVPPAVKNLDGEEIAGWGKVVDPKQDCAINSTKDSLTITIPGGEHNLNPTPQFNDLSAPRILQQVEEDFQLEVRLDAFPPPETGSAGVYQSYVGAGLVLWQDDKNFVRFLRAANGASGNVFVHFEYFQNGALATANGINFSNQPLSLRIVRTDKQFRFFYELEGAKWIEMKLDAPVQLAGKLEAGIFATSSTEQPFQARFTQFRFQPKSGSSAAGWVQLFNGKDLDGWVRNTDFPGNWRVEKGILVGSGPERMGLLHTARSDIGNFHLRAEVLINSEADGGIWFRSLPQTSNELNLCFDPKLPTQQTGSLVIHKQNTKASTWHSAPPGLAKANEWMTVEIIAQGDQATTKINGQTAAISQSLCGNLRGHIMLQHLRTQAVVRFRKIEIKELPSSDSSGEAASRRFASDEWIDVIPLIDPRLDRHGNKLTGRNEWRVDNGELVVGYADEKPNKLLLPLDSDWQAFECEFELTRRTGESAFGLNFPVKQSDVPLVVDLTGRQVSLGRRAVIGEIDPIQNGQRAKISVRARKQDGTDHLEVTVNGKSVGTWTGNRSMIEAISGEGYAHARRLSFWIPGGSEYVFHQIRIRMLDGGTAETLRPVPRATHLATPSPAVAPFDAAQAKVHQNAWAKHLGVKVEYTNSIGMKFVLIPPGEFTMGSTQAEFDLFKAEERIEELKRQMPEHTVRFSRPVWLGATEVSVGQFRRFVADTNYKTEAERDGTGGDVLEQGKHAWKQGIYWDKPGYLHTEDCAVTQVSWNDAAEFCNWLSRQEKLAPVYVKLGEEWRIVAGPGYRLPSEAEWEFACRAGTRTSYFFGDDPKLLGNYAWSSGNADGHPHPVGTKLPNPFGLFDVLGNVREWVGDWDGDLNELAAPSIDPQGPATGTRRVMRGSGWSSTPISGSSAFRSHTFPRLRLAYLGFRVASGDDLKFPAKQEPLPSTFKNALGMEFAIVPKGKSWLGGGKDKPGNKEVEIPADFYLGKYEVTQEEWEKVMGVNSSYFSRTGDGKDAVKDISDADLKRFPTENVSWDQCQIFVTKLNKLETEVGWVYRLPTTDEWEYACRGGPMADKLGSAFDFYLAEPTNTLLPEQANIKGNGLDRTCKVGSYPPNRLGLFDMHGNVSEYFVNTWELPKGTHFMCRGGTWKDDSGTSKLSIFGTKYGTREGTFPNWGLRLARVPSGAPSPAAKTPPAAAAPFNDADVQRIAALPAAEQVEEVRKELMRRNPGFDGKVGQKIEDGVVTEFSIVTDQVTDISPIRVFNSLQMLECRGPDLGNDGKPKGQVADLTPLNGLNLAGLRHLDLREQSKVTDAAMVYFKGCRDLRHLSLGNTRVTDSGLAHFNNCKALTNLGLYWTNVGDAGLQHFQDCKDLTSLNLAGTKVSDAGLAHFKNCKNLRFLSLDHTQVSDAGLAHFEGIPLTWLWIDASGISDLTPLQGMPLEEIHLTPKNIVKGLDVLRDMKSLKTVGIEWNHALPAAEFWQRYDKGEFKE